MGGKVYSLSRSKEPYSKCTNVLFLSIILIIFSLKKKHPINRHWFVYRRAALVSREEEKMAADIDEIAVRLLYGEVNIAVSLNSTHLFKRHSVCD